MGNIQNDYQSEGGAIYFKGNGIVSDCIFTHNIVKGYGGAIHFAGDGTVKDSIFTDNSAVYRYYDKIYEVYIIEGWGGAIYFDGNGIVTDCILTSNTAGVSGGAIYFKGKGVVTDCILTGNTARKSDGGGCGGGAIYFSKNSTVSNCNFISNNASWIGGAICSDDECTVNNCNFTGNNAEESSGGAIHFKSNGVVIDCILTGNTARKSVGGAIYVEGDSIITNCNFTDNAGKYDSAIGSNGVGNVSDCIFINNTAPNGNVVSFSFGGTLNDCIFNANIASTVIYLRNGNASDCIFNANMGRVIQFYYAGTVKNCIFTDNVVKSYGGAIYFRDNGIASNCTFTGNRAIEYGGAIYFRGNGIASNCTFLCNTAGESGGAILFENDGNASDCIFIDNTAGESGGAIYFNSYGSGIVNDCIFVGNGAVEYDDIYGNAIYGDSCSINDNWWGSNNPDWDSLISGYATKASSYIVLNGVLNPKTVPLGSKVELNYTFYKNGTRDIVAIPIRQIELSSDDGHLDDTSGYLVDGKFSTKYSSNVVGTYIITAKVDNEEIQIPVEVINPVPKENLSIEASAEPITIGGDATIVVTGLKDATGEITVTIGSDKWNGRINGGRANVIVNGLKDNVVASVNYGGDDKYNPAKTSVNIIVLPDIDVIISAPEVVKYYNGSERFVVTLMDSGSNPLPNQQISIIINGSEFRRITNGEGQASIAINLNSGFYEVLVKYEVINVTSSITILPTVYGNDVVKIYKNDVQYYATFLDSEGNYLPKGTTVTFNLDNNFYSQTIIDNKGSAKLDINNKPGKYLITAMNPVTEENSVNSITVIPTIIENQDTVTYYNESKKFSVKVLDSKGNVASGQKVKFTIGNTTYESTSDFKGQAFLNVILQPGTYIVTTTYGDLEINNTIYILPTISDNDMQVSSPNIDEGEKEIIEVILPYDATGKVSVAINSKEYSANVNKGKSNIIISYLKYGTYNIDVIYSGDSQYNSVKCKTSFIVNKTIDLSVPDVSKFYGGSERLFVTLKDKNGQPISNAEIKITINSQIYIRTTNNNGQASMAINLNGGIYNVTTDYGGVKVNSIITIVPTIMAKDLTKIFRNGTQYQGTFTDSQGNLLKNVVVKFNINGVFYTRTTDEMGIAKMNINLNPDTYILTATNTVTGENRGTNITVLSNIFENHDLTKYYKNTSHYIIRLLDDKGKPVGAGVSVEFNINGVFYTRSSNATGHVKMNVNLNPGTYIITANYKGLMTSNTITVKPILQSKDLNMKYGDGSKFELKLLDGQGRPFAGQKITFNINGVFYDRNTDVNGVARLNINLMAGQYIITSMYSNGAATSNKVTISS